LEEFKKSNVGVGVVLRGCRFKELWEVKMSLRKVAGVGGDMADSSGGAWRRLEA